MKIAFENEQKERRLSAKQALDDLKLRGEQERAQLEADHRARLAEIERGLRADTQAFIDAYNNQLRDLDTYLAQREQKWRDHQAAIEAILGIGSPSKWMEDIGKQMRAGLDIGFAAPSVATDLQQAVANFGKASNNLAMPMSAGGGASNVSNTTHNHNVQLTANYRNMQSESSLRRDLMNIEAGMRMRVP